MNKLLSIAAAASVLAMTAAPAFAQSVEWQRKVATIVASKQVYPRVAQMRGIEGTARVKVSVDAGGGVANVELVVPSGETVLDKEAVELPRRVGALPPPPGGPTSVVLPLTWKLL